MINPPGTKNQRTAKPTATSWALSQKVLSQKYYRAILVLLAIMTQDIVAVKRDYLYAVAKR
jgi:hypothetical protein